MRTTATLWALLTLPAAAQTCTIPVRMNNLAAAPPAALFQAKSTASVMFARIGVKLQWQPSAYRHTAPACRPPIEIHLNSGNPPSDRPESLAYAQPYLETGAAIEVFVGRVASIVPAANLGVLLGHVLAHEIAHVLQGANRHSDQGVMKARWDATDFREMAGHPLPFAAADVLLIQAAARRTSTGTEASGDLQ